MKRLALFFFVGCATNSFGPRQFTARYARENTPAHDAPQCAGFSRISVRDARSEPKVVGDRSREGAEATQPLTMNGDAAAWVKEGLESQARASQFLVGSPQHLALDVAINSIDLHEKIFQNAEYDARIVVEVSIAGTNGQTCLKATFEGAGRNYGSEGSTENYAQTLNRALDAAAGSMFDNAAFRDAACLKCGS